MLALRLSAIRAYSSSAKEGSVASSKGFAAREQGEEKAYVLKHEAQLLAKLKAEIAQKKAEATELEKTLSEKESKK